MFRNIVYSICIMRLLCGAIMVDDVVGMKTEDFTEMRTKSDAVLLPLTLSFPYHINNAGGALTDLEWKKLFESISGSVDFLIADVGKSNVSRMLGAIQAFCFPGAVFSFRNFTSSDCFSDAARHVKNFLTLFPAALETELARSGNQILYSEILQFTSRLKTMEEKLSFSSVDYELFMSLHDILTSSGNNSDI